MENKDKKEGLGSNFIKSFIEEDLKEKRFDRVHTRFPPEPNGYLHIGHAKAITISYETAKEFGGVYNLRFDDTNPVKEDTEYEEAIKRDIKWLGYDWEDRLYYASDYFDRLYEFAVLLIKKGYAYVCDLSQDQVKDYRGSLTEPGKESPFRNRSVEENLDLFERMKNGEFEEGSRVLRAKIDMSSPNINMRDPVMYRILKKSHHRTENKWVIYPSYDFTHGQSDSIEGITHSLCDISFENHRPLYEWFLEKLDIFRSRQIEFARLNLTYTITSKRFLKQLVDQKIVSGWDDPRMPTIIGLRRRGYPAEAIIEFMKSVGVSKKENVINIENFEYFIRENLKKSCPRIMAVLDPVKLTVKNYPDGMSEIIEMETYPDKENPGFRKVLFEKDLFVERSDYQDNDDPSFYRLAPGKYVKLRKSYIVKCLSAVKNPDGSLAEIICEYVPESKHLTELDGKKIKGIIHWVSQSDSTECTVRLYDRLFKVENPLDSKGLDFSELINCDSFKEIKKCRIEKCAESFKPEDRVQFERTGYFCLDMKDSVKNGLIFNRTLTLK
ncbi:MAG TPA: glutamine--tRNA ligase/YqeY domain fusion protein [Clostridiales bacterium]|jgi:glutaminyl-tRNA synthetase|nr:glutamine--tRNA ligase/YqeY domain fusion protein [Clostridiales bacterium]HQP69405.1 glutamine--tRNA ligase/YqeY domain fusion protein [Clostridiales bacterium]